MSKKRKRVYLENEYPPWFYYSQYNDSQMHSRDSYNESSRPAWGIRYIYALILLIVIVLQFGRDLYPQNTYTPSGCIYEEMAGGIYSNQKNTSQNNQLIDNSVLFIIVVFLLVICSGCWRNDKDSGGYY